MSTPDCTTFSTLAIHAGFDPDPMTGDVVPPIHVASTFVQDRPGQLREGYEYGRCGNPTTNAFAGALAALEGAAHGFAFPSGMSAEDTVIRLLARPGDHVVHSTDVYGGTHKLLSVIKPAEGITSEAVDLTDLAEAERVARERGATSMRLHAQCRAAGFYERAGYEQYGPVELDEHVEHVWMRKRL